MRSNSRSILIDATLGTVTPTARLQVQGGGGRTPKVMVNIMGRVRTRSATPGWVGYVPG